MLRTLCVATFVLGLTSAASAQDASPLPHEPTDAELAEARHSFELATRAFESGDYENAVSEFRTALELSGAPDLLFNIYLAEERAGRLPEAADALEQYLARATVDAEQRTLLDGRLARLRARIASHTGPVAPETPEALLASPIAPAETAEVVVEDTTVAPVEPRPVSTSPPAAAIGLLVTAGVLAINFGVFAGLSIAENDRLTGACNGRCSSSDVASLNTFDIVADVSWIGAAALGVAGLVLLFVLPPDTHDDGPRVALAPWIGPGGAGLAMGGQL